MGGDYSLPLTKFRYQRYRAKERGIEWDFSFEEWMAVWEESGKWHLRGKRAGCYVMGRKGDTGPYSRDNVEIIPFEQNIRDGHKSSRGKRGSSGNLGRGRGWTYLKRGKRRYQVVLGRHYVGSFLTQEEAEAAYRAAVESAAKKFS